MKKQLFNKKGLSLIEVIVGFMLIGILVTPISMLFITAQRINQRSRALLTHTYLAQQYMERAKHTTNMAAHFTEIILPDENVKIIQITKPHPDVRLAYRLQKLEIQVRDLGDGQEILKLLSLRKIN